MRKDEGTIPILFVEHPHSLSVINYNILYFLFIVPSCSLAAHFLEEPFYGVVCTILLGSLTIRFEFLAIFFFSSTLCFAEDPFGIQAFGSVTELLYHYSANFEGENGSIVGG